MTGDFAAGWDAYEWRFRCDMQERALPWPVWNGGSLTDKSLLIHAEQGVGDEILFASCVPDVAKAAQQCVFECDRRLAPLFARSFHEVVVVPRREDFQLTPDDVPVRVDERISAGSLPRFFRRAESDFPARSGYLSADAAATKTWRARLQNAGPGLKVGFSWRGGKSANLRARRSTELAQWAPIFSTPGVRFVNLQYDDDGEAARAQGAAVHDFSDLDRRNELDRLAALISALDLVISVDNSTVHLAGALGVPTWVLLPFVADWRWMLDREDSPWYSSVRLFRKRRDEGWEDLLSRVAFALHECVSTPRGNAH
jgi:hypothetical protein